VGEGREKVAIVDCFWLEHHMGCLLRLTLTEEEKHGCAPRSTLGCWRHQVEKEVQDQNFPGDLDNMGTEVARSR
jgi:hypothetical protein